MVGAWAAIRQSSRMATEVRISIEEYWSSEYEEFEWLPFNIVGGVIALFGLLGNIALLVTYSKKDKTNRFNNLMCLIGIFDLIFVTVDIVWIAIDFEFDLDSTPYYKVFYFVYEWSLSGSAYATALMALERYCILCKSL